jgi:hypothetical protein
VRWSMMVWIFRLTEKLIEFDFAEDGTQRSLCKLRGLVDVVSDLDGGVVGIDDVERDDGVHFERDVVAGDNVLRRHFEHVLAERDADHLIEGTEDEDDSRPLGHGQSAAQTEDDTALIFAQDLDGVEQIENDNSDDDENRGC